ncbi:hypothetical protein [Xylanimonas sp. McL0601]|uniref:hypothetical protein n=1 Tax=Xylanimonas sp. McL0601 TaxID=3414739 RepID=UPI003CEB5191
MARRRDPGKNVEFDLLPDDEDASGAGRFAAPSAGPEAVLPGWPPAPGPDEAGHGGRRFGPPGGADRTATRRRRRAVAVFAALAVAVASGAAATASYRSAADYYLLERLASAPGGVVGLDRPPMERWSTAVAEPTPVAVLDGLLVVDSRGDPSNGTTLHGIDPRSGRVRWSVRLPGVVDCGSRPRHFLYGPILTFDRPSVDVVDKLACLTGEQQNGVVVVGPGGRILAKREIADRAAAAFLAVGQGGTLVRVDVVGGPDEVPAVRDGAASPSPDGAISPVLDAPLVVHDRRIRLEDAVTGAALWTTTVPGSTVPERTPLGSSPCLAALDDTLPAVVAASLGSRYDRSGRTAWYSTCGIDVALDLATGAVLSTHLAVEPALQGFGSPVRSLGDGAYVVEDPTPGKGSVTIAADGGVTTTWEQQEGVDPVVHLFRPGGQGLGEVAGTVLSPLATDGSHDDLLITTGTEGTSVYDAFDATQRWTDPGSAMELLVRSARTLVTSTGTDITARDPGTGARLWRTVPWDPANTWSGGPLGLDGIVAVYTDGRRAVLVEALNDFGRSPDGGTDRRWTAIDLASGAREWRATVGGRVPTAIAGHLYRFDDDAVVGLG